MWASAFDWERELNFEIFLQMDKKKEKKRLDKDLEVQLETVADQQEALAALEKS